MHTRLHPFWLLIVVVVAAVGAAACDREPQTTADYAVGAPPEPGSAGWITTKIQAAYFADPEIKPWNIDVTTSATGVVTLRGDVDTAADRDTALRIARQTEGVMRVEDLLRVKGEAVATAGTTRPEETMAARDPMFDRPDMWITTKIQAKYYTDDEVRARNVDVDAQGGVVTLRGTVGSYAVRRQAVALARNTEGVREVRDELQVDPALAADARAGGAIDDAWIETKIRAKYFLDSEVKGRDVAVAVSGGVVTLTGSVSSEAEKTTAGQIATETEGVSEVRNQLQVGASQAPAA